MKLNTMVLIENCVVAACWTYIAIYFGKWWIALMMILCWTSIEEPGGK